MQPLNQLVAGVMALALGAASAAAQSPVTAGSATAASQGLAAVPPAQTLIAPPAAATSGAESGSLQKHVAPMALKIATAAPLESLTGGKQAPAAGTNEASTLHLIVGRSLFVHLPEKLR